MNDPKEQRPEADELQLDAETVKDLQPSPEDADEIRGGKCVAGYTYLCQAPSGTLN